MGNWKKTMASSDDEGEAVPHLVSNYYFVDDKDEFISFSELPVQWNEGECRVGEKKEIFLRGDTDNGLQKLYKQVTAWKFDLSGAKPDISVLFKENNWIKLQKPRKCFEDTIRTILITVHFLHAMKKYPETSGRALWDHLSRVLRWYKAKPSETNLVDHMNLINEAVRRDKALGKSKFLVKFQEELPRKRKAFEIEDGSDKGDGVCDSVCAICDEGGDLLCCEGRCFRSFHATFEAGSGSNCKSLSLNDDQVEAIQNFWCKNCQYKQHQCFCCGELGSSDNSSCAGVFRCFSGNCGQFYHPHCVAKLLHRGSEAEAEGLQKKITAGESFTCPVHKCYVCKQGENEMDPDLQFAICRRCPMSYHRKCLPWEIAFEYLKDEGIVKRAWDGLLPNRILIYCLNHKMDDATETPMRNHIRFPNVTPTRNHTRFPNATSIRNHRKFPNVTPIRNHIRLPTVGQKNKTQTSELLSTRKKVAWKERSLASEDASGKGTVVKPLKGIEKFSSAMKCGDSSRKRKGILSGPAPSKKQKVLDTSQKPLNKTSSTKVGKSMMNESKTSLGTLTEPVAKETSSSQLLDADSKKRILALMEDAASFLTLGKIIENHKVPQTITLEKVKGSIKALRTALQKLEEGCCIEDAIAVCKPGLLNQIIEWESKLNVYLAPVLYGPSYAFGHPGVAADPSDNRISTSMMQRNAPQLDGLNDAKINNLASEQPSVRSGIYDPPTPRPGIRPESLGFAPGPCQPCSQHNSSGWLDE